MLELPGGNDVINAGNTKLMDDGAGHQIQYFP